LSVSARTGRSVLTPLTIPVWISSTPAFSVRQSVSRGFGLLYWSVRSRFS